MALFHVVGGTGGHMLTVGKLRELMRKAESATPGPWAVNPQQRVNVESCAQNLLTVAVCRGSDDLIDTDRQKANAEYLAAANPAVVSELATACLEMREVLKFYGGMGSKYGQASWFRSQLLVDESVGLTVSEENGSLARLALAKHFSGDGNKP